jgi:hypothetical protein
LLVAARVLLRHCNKTLQHVRLKTPLRCIGKEQVGSLIVPPSVNRDAGNGIVAALVIVGVVA